MCISRLLYTRWIWCIFVCEEVKICRWCGGEGVGTKLHTMNHVGAGSQLPRTSIYNPVCILIGSLFSWKLNRNICLVLPVRPASDIIDLLHPLGVYDILIFQKIKRRRRRIHPIKMQIFEIATERRGPTKNERWRRHKVHTCCCPSM